MKAFVIVFALAAAKAESDAQYYGVNPYVAGSPFVQAVQPYGIPQVYSTYAAQPAYLPLIHQGPRYVAKNGAVEHIVQKREAEADAEAEAQYFATPYAGYGYAPQAYAGPVAYTTPYGYGVSSYANDAVRPQGYAAKGQYVAQTAGSIHIAKREAEADAEAQYFATPYAGYGYAPQVYAGPVAYTTPYGYGVSSYANDAVRPQGYAAKGQYVAKTAGSIHIAKREAEAEPEAQYYNSYAGAYPAFTYGARPLTGYSGYSATVGYPYAASFNRPYSGLYY